MSIFDVYYMFIFLILYSDSFPFITLYIYIL